MNYEKKLINKIMVKNATFKSKMPDLDKIDPMEGELTIVVKNLDEEKERVVELFGALKETIQKPPVQIEVVGGDYNMLRKWLVSNAFLIYGAIVGVSQKKQFSQNIEVSGYSPFKKQLQQDYPICLPTWASYDFMQNWTVFDKLQMPNLYLLISAGTELRFTLLPDTTITFTFYIKKRTNIRNLLMNGNMVCERNEPVEWASSCRASSNFMQVVPDSSFVTTIDMIIENLKMGTDPEELIKMLERTKEQAYELRKENPQAVDPVTVQPSVIACIPYQTCPVCVGQGTVSRPPYIAGDSHEWSSSSSGGFPCPVCHGAGVIPMKPIE